MWPNPQETADLVILAEKISDGKFPFLCSGIDDFMQNISQKAQLGTLLNYFVSITYIIYEF